MTEKRILRGDRCRCSGCGEYFNSTSAFDKHRVGREGKTRVERRCLSVSEMVELGMALNSSDFWCGSLRTQAISPDPLPL